MKIKLKMTAGQCQSLLWTPPWLRWLSTLSPLDAGLRGAFPQHTHNELPRSQLLSLVLAMTGHYHCLVCHLFHSEGRLSV